MFNEKLLARLGIVWLLMLAAGTWGFLAGRYEVFPFDQFQSTSEFFEYQAVHDGADVFQAMTKHVQERPCEDCGQGGFTRHDESFRDSGYLLLPRYSQEHAQKIVELVRLSDFKVLHTWVPDVESFLKAYRPGMGDECQSVDYFTATHAFLFPNGDIVTHSKSPLSCFDREGKLKWMWNRDSKKVAHHAIEMDHHGNLIVTANLRTFPEYAEDQSPNERANFQTYAPDGVAVVSPATGEIIKEFLISDILDSNGYGALLLNSYHSGCTDPLHLNDAEPVLADVGIMKQGDLVISLRNVSTIFVYRPSTNQIIWLRTGPWFQQHDPRVLPEGRISVFSNNSYPELSAMQAETSDVYIIDPATNQYETPYHDIMKKMQVFTFEQGRSRILPDGDLIVEQTIGSRILRLTRDKPIWEYVNRTREGYVGNINWSRYYLPSEIDLRWLYSSSGEESDLMME